MKALRKLMGVSVLVVLCFAFGFSWRDLQRGAIPSGSTILSAVGIVEKKPFNPTELFSKSFERIASGYYQKVDRQQMKFASMAGMLASLGDPHTAYLEPKAAKEFAMETRANFVGIGARLSPDPLGAKVVSVFESSPAMRAGFKASDVITAVDGKTVAGNAIDAIVSKIRGEPGTKVSLTVIRPSSEKPLVLTATRAQIIAPTVEGRVLEGTDVGYLQISSFAEPTAEQFDKELAKLQKANIDGLVIDVRSNPGGLLQTAVDVLSRFVENKVVVKMKMRNGREEVARTETGLLASIDVPVAVLINEDSASASEIFAGVLRDYRLATLVGEHSYGKASVQNVFQLIDGSNAKVTIARYYLPSGDYIGRKIDEDGQYISGGIVPSEPAELDYTKNPVFGELASDSQLQRAVDVVRSKR